MQVTAPTLTSFVTEPEQMLNVIWNNFYVNESDQSNLFDGQIESLSYLTQKFQHLPDTMAEEVGNALKRICKNHFDNVDVRCVAGELNARGQYSLTLSVIAYKGTKEYDLNRSIELIQTT